MSIALLFASLSFPGAALAGVDAEVDTVTSLVGSIAPEGEVDTLRFDAVAGTVVSISVSAKTIDFDLMLFNPADGQVDLASAGKFADGGAKVKVSKLVLATTGTYRLEVKGSGTGDYKLSIKGKVAGKFRATLDVDPLTPANFAFAAPAGSAIQFSAKAAKGSAAQPRFGDFEGQDLTGEGKFSATAHAVKLAGVAAGGDLSVEVQNLGAAMGMVTVQVSVKAPKKKGAKLDFRGSALGMPNGGETVVSDTVDAGGELIEVSDEESPLDGVSVDVPAGAVAGDTRITLNSSPPLALVDPETTQAAGPAVHFGPENTTFAMPVTVTIPYDPTQLPFGADPGSDLQVLKIEADGTTTTLVPTAVDLVGETVSVDVTSFSSFGVTTPRGSPNLDGREYWFMFGEFELRAPPMGNESWQRSIFQGYGTAEFGGAGAGTFSAQGTENELHHDHDAQALGSVNTATGVFEPSEGPGDPDGDEGSWTYLPGLQKVRLNTGPGEDDDYWVSRDGGFLMALAPTSAEGFTGLDIAVEKPDTLPTPASLAGTYQYGELFYEAFSMGGGPVGLESETAYGTVTLREDGTFRATVSGFFRESDGGSLVADSGSEVDEGTFSVLPDGSIQITTFDGEEENDFFFPSADGQVIIGAISAGVLGELAVLVRQSSASAAAFEGDYATLGLEVELKEDSINATTVFDFETFNLDDVISFDGDGGAAHSNPTERAVYRNPLVAGGVGVDSDTDSFLDTAYSVDKKGKFSSQPADGEGSVVGGITSDGEFGFFVPDDPSSTDTHGLFLMLQLPPEDAP